MLNHKPLHPKHAIEQMVVGFKLAVQLNERDFIEIEKLSHSIEKILPKKDRLNRFEVKITGLETTKGEAEHSGFQFRSMDSNGNTDWQLKIQEDIFTVTCFSYTRWSEVSAKAVDIFSVVFQALAAKNPQILQTVMQYTDKFIFEEDLDNYRIGDLFDIKSKYLTEQVQKSGYAWHIHQGWFEKINEPIRYLNMLNLTAVSAEGQPHVTTVDHIITTQYVQDAKLLADFSDDFGYSAFDLMHIMNKQVLSKLLNSKMQKIIGLEVNNS